MPSYKDESRSKNIWFCKFQYPNLKGEIKTKFKRGFTTKREADQFERDFLNNISLTPDMDFNSLVDMYFIDYKNRVKEVTFKDNNYIVKRHILPYFKDMQIKDITPLLIRDWQNSIMNYVNPATNRPYSNWYLKTIHKNINAVFNFAVSFLGLTENPCKKAGSMGKAVSEKELNYWTLEEFKTFIDVVDRLDLYTGFSILYWTGMRVGELLALTWNDIDINKKTIRINKTYQRVNKKDLITSPKTQGSKRTIKITSKLLNMILDYKERIYKPKSNERLFQFQQRVFSDWIKRYSEASGVKVINVHDLRHSHASLLINNNANVLLISQRLGHDRIETTLNIYSHLFPDIENQIINKLEELE